jgi:hypothetical protein
VRFGLRRVTGFGIAALTLASPGCAGDPPPAVSAPDADPVIQSWAMRERVARVEVGQSRDQARAILGDAPVRKPGHPEDPFPTPLRSLELAPGAGPAVRVELYVVASYPAQGCPDVHFRDVPIVFVDDVVAGTDWAFVERNWRAWGGSLATLREARDGRQCPLPPLPVS